MARSMHDLSIPTDRAATMSGRSIRTGLVIARSTEGLVDSGRSAVRSFESLAHRDLHLAAGLEMGALLLLIGGERAKRPPEDPWEFRRRTEDDLLQDHR